MSLITTPRDLPKGAASFDPKAGVFLDAKGKPLVKKGSHRPKPVSRDEFVLDTRSVYDKDQAMILDEERRVMRDADGFLVTNAGKKRLGTKPPRRVYHRGTHWRVIADNVRIEAMCHYGSNGNGGAIWSGWSQRLPIGTELECIGWRRFRRDGLVAPQFVYPGLPSEARWSTIWPLDGIWRPWPLAGILEEVIPE